MGNNRKDEIHQESEAGRQARGARTFQQAFAPEAEVLTDDPAAPGKAVRIPRGGVVGMKSYALAVALAMLLAAVYAFQNAGEIIVRFLVWERAIPQGIWEVLLFAAGGILMWLVSLSALMETRGKYVRQVREKEKKIRELEEERASLLAAISARREEAAAVRPESASEISETAEVASEPEESTEESVSPENRRADEGGKPFDEEDLGLEPEEELLEERDDDRKGV